MLNLSCVPKAPCNFAQNRDVNLGPLSDIMEAGTPCLLTISFTYNLTSLSKEKEVLIGTKWVVFVNLSTITQMASLPLVVLKRPTTKSIVTWPTSTLVRAVVASCLLGVDVLP